MVTVETTTSLHGLFSCFFLILSTTACVLSYLILSQWRVVFVGQASLDECCQRLGPPLSHPGIRVLADLQGTPHWHTNADTCVRQRCRGCSGLCFPAVFTVSRCEARGWNKPRTVWLRLGSLVTTVYALTDNVIMKASVDTHWESGVSSSLMWYKTCLLLKAFQLICESSLVCREVCQTDFYSSGIRV